MRRLSLFILFLLTVTTIQAESPLKDSLITVLNRTQDPQAKLSLYRNLADLSFDQPKERYYLEQIYLTAREIGQQETMLEALLNLANNHIDEMEMDSARHYMELLEKLAPKEQADQWLSYLRMRAFSIDISEGSGKEAIEKVLDTYNAKKEQPNPYKQIEDAYIVGCAFYYGQRKAPESLPYFKLAAEQADKLSLEEGLRYKFITLRTYSLLLGITGSYEESIANQEKAIEIQEKYHALYCQHRPFYPMDNFYIQGYTSLMTNAHSLPKERAEYYIGRLRELCGNSTVPAHKYRYYLSMNNYYTTFKDYTLSQLYMDSLIQCAEKIAPYNLAALYSTSATIYELMNKPAEALAALKTSIRINDSIQAQEAQGKLNELQVKFDVNRLNYEKSQLEIRNKQIMLLGLGLLLVLVILVCAYLYRNLKREREMKAVMENLKKRAEESERMKTAFTNSMCHEIRTPLNAIVGFSDLLFDPSIDEEVREQFPAEIQKSTTLLTSLINSILEVSNLDVSDEKLPCEVTDISTICQQEMDALSDRISAGVECVTHIPENPFYICTNARYLALVIENLLSNADKFTTQGSITLACHRETDHFVMSVTDTGCGIPPDMRETVFERFTKIDNYKQGSGLGLYLCRLIVTRLGGKIYIDPGYDSGTRMVVELPNECA